MDDNKIFKYILGHATREEKEEFLNWIDESDDNTRRFVRCGTCLLLQQIM